MAHILLVDDNDELRNLYGTVLAAAGHEISTAHDGHEALELAQTRQPDVILMDLEMPVLDGIDATRALKRSPAADIPVIALTNKQLPHEVSEALEAGCDGVIAKPLDPGDLIEELALYLRELE